MTDIPIPFGEHPVARSADPETSHEAAESVRNVTDTHDRILGLLRSYGPLTDSGIREIWTRLLFPRTTDSGLRTRRAELVKAGLVVDTGTRVKLASGRRSIVWGLASVQRDEAS